MKKFLCTLVAVSFLLIPGAAVCSARIKSPEIHKMKLLHKEQMKALKLREHFMKQSWKNQHVPKAVREQQKHQLERQMRELRNRQKDEMQDLQDRMRLAKGP
jgi:hypothetical protein